MDERFQMTMGKIERRRDLDGNDVYWAQGRFSFRQTEADRDGLISKDVTLELLKNTYQEAVGMDSVLGDGVSLAIRVVEKIPGMRVENIPASIPGMRSDEYEQLLENYRRASMRSVTEGFTGKVGELLELCARKGITVVVDRSNDSIRFHFYKSGYCALQAFPIHFQREIEEAYIVKRLMESIENLLMAPFRVSMGVGG